MEGDRLMLDTEQRRMKIKERIQKLGTLNLFIIDTKKLAKKYGVSRKTIQRDIAVIKKDLAFICPLCKGRFFAVEDIPEDTIFLYNHDHFEIDSKPIIVGGMNEKEKERK